MKKDKNLSTLSLAILGLLSQKPLSGYDIRKVFSTTPLGHFSSSPGAIYPALRRIKASGWICPVAADEQSGRRRTIYEIAPCGLEVLKRHLLQPVTQDDVIWRMDDLMLRFAFMDQTVGRRRTLAFLKDFALKIDAYVADLRRYLDGAASAMPPCGRLAMENGIQSYEMNAQWARRAVEELGNRALPGSV